MNQLQVITTSLIGCRKSYRTAWKLGVITLLLTRRNWPCTSVRKSEARGEGVVLRHRSFWC